MKKVAVMQICAQASGEAGVRRDAVRVIFWALPLVANLLGGLAASRPALTAPVASLPSATLIAEDGIMFSDVVSFVQRNGWPQDLGPYCETLGLARANPDCRFKQLGAEDNAKPDEGHAIHFAGERWRRRALRSDVAETPGDRGGVHRVAARRSHGCIPRDRRDWVGADLERLGHAKLHR